MDTLDHRIDLLGRRLESSATVKVEAPRTSVPPPLPPTRAEALAMFAPPVGVPPGVEMAAGVGSGAGAPPATSPTGVPPVEDRAGELPVPPPASEMPVPAGKAPPPLPAGGASAPLPAAEPLELRVGTYWLARIGIVILLTGLVFLGNYAYHLVIASLGPWGKLALLALAGGGLAGVGAWLERSRESMRNYARVLMAGGAATLYYTVYAAHFVERLRVIESPIVGGTLLLAMASAFIWYADKKRSEALAVPGLLLAYYTSAINAIGAFTLFSNLLLTGAAVFFLVRHRWTRMSYASLAATYGSYAFWRFHQVV